MPCTTKKSTIKNIRVIGDFLTYLVGVESSRQSRELLGPSILLASVCNLLFLISFVRS
jgi:hypothetical protein